MKVPVPITPDVLDWAIKESGYTHAEVAMSAHVDDETLGRWLTGDEQPGLSEIRRVAAKLHRQLATFLLPSRPESEHTAVEFRHPMGVLAGRSLTAIERRYVRRARRLQEVQAWLIGELALDDSTLQPRSIDESPAVVAAAFRSELNVSIDAQRKTPSPAKAFDLWRSALESVGISVFQFSMGEENCRGFSLWDDRAPLVAVNTAWPDEARIFTLFHETGHLLTRTEAACARAVLTPNANDRPERWCEAFSAAVLIPAEALTSVVRVEDIKSLSSLARSLRVSLRAMALRLIDLGKARWELYEGIPAIADKKPKSDGGTGRTRSEIRADEFGERTTRLFVTAVQREVISQSQALDYLDIPSAAFGRLVGTPVG